MDDIARIGFALLGLQITTFGAMMALAAAAGLQYWQPETGFVVAVAGFVVSVPALLVRRTR